MRRAALGLLLLTGCFGGARPIKQMGAGEFMVGGNLDIPGTSGDPELAAWVRFAPYGSADLTVGAIITAPLAADGVGYGGLAQIRQHIPITEGWRIALDLSGELFRLRFNDADRGTHYRLRFTPYFVVDAELYTVYFGPKGGWFTGVREISAPFGQNPIRPVPGAPGMVFVGASFGAEDPKPVWHFTSLGVAMDAGVVIDAQSGRVAIPISYAMSIYFGFL